MEANPAKLFVGNLSWKVRDNDLIELFGQYGNIVKAEVVMDKFNRNHSRGIAFVEFDDPEAAQAAIKALHETEFFERKLLVNVSEPPKKRDFGGGRGSDRGYRI
ncbi:RNA-binding protein [Microgenomates group bacterium]|nr:RNA-binding protein [Microgenomates group bacterium]